MFPHFAMRSQKTILYGFYDSRCFSWIESLLLLYLVPQMLPCEGGRVASTVAVEDSEESLFGITIEYHLFEIFHFFTASLISLAIYPDNYLSAFRLLGHFDCSFVRALLFISDARLSDKFVICPLSWNFHIFCLNKQLLINLSISFRNRPITAQYDQVLNIVLLITTNDIACCKY